MPHTVPATVNASTLSLYQYHHDGTVFRAKPTTMRTISINTIKPTFGNLILCVISSPRLFAYDLVTTKQ